MREALTELNKTPGVLGSAIVAGDGLVIASQSSTALGSEELWQHALRAFQDFAGVSQACGCGDCHSAALEWEDGKMVARVIPLGVLLAAANSQCPLGAMQMAVEQAAAGIAAMGVEGNAADQAR